MASTDRTVLRQWPARRVGLALVLALLPLTLALPRTLGDAGDRTDGTARLVLAVVVTALWVYVVGGRGREERPVATLVLTGVFAGCYTFLVAAVAALSSAGAAGLIALPFLLLVMVAVGALWGLAAGGLARGLQLLRGRSARVIRAPRRR
ncbi:hypothetical protein FHE66_07785 [Georgenia sp. 311]|uniref:Uncharacterized protein n=1 Tax=Georgenia wutianyii TaxID=2585135 RepID=A0ABX5VPS6_9MICO|nr:MULTISPECIES: hypothetical protein [Georgenia]QDB80462.1 hypothetical protein FE251_14580 [Georgenia wutianyii]TNC18325.1 hypothetical protein FHE66_07785 [Georgenia sp. 311]